MAITQGINGTFFPAQDYETVEPVYIRKFKKTIPVDNGWEDRVFYEITKFPMGRQATFNLLTEHYGEPKYSNTWWSTFNGISMNEQIYTYYKLME
jgi:hypothetical protein